nr:putative receptor protein kinase zmpk1 [Quercus suber]
MANRDHPVNGKHSKLSLLNSGNLILTNATKSNVTVWATNTATPHLVQLFLYNTGNLVLLNKDYFNLWESFDFPTDTLLPQQLLTRKTKLVSSRSQTNFSSSFYKLSFNIDNLLRFFYNGLDVSNIYWFYSGLEDYNISTLVFNSLGNLSPSDDFTIMSADYGAMLHRRLTLDYNGNIRLYSWEKKRQSWVVSWQAIQRPCIIAGAYEANSFCDYVTSYGRKCSCPPRYKMKNRIDSADGYELEVELSCKVNESGFLMLSHVDFYSYYRNDFGTSSITH